MALELHLYYQPPDGREPAAFDRARAVRLASLGRIAPGDMVEADGPDGRRWLCKARIFLLGRLADGAEIILPWPVAEAMLEQANNQNKTHECITIETGPAGLDHPAGQTL